MGAWWGKTPVGPMAASRAGPWAAEWAFPRVDCSVASLATMPAGQRAGSWVLEMVERKVVPWVVARVVQRAAAKAVQMVDCSVAWLATMQAGQRAVLWVLAMVERTVVAWVGSWVG